MNMTKGELISTLLRISVVSVSTYLSVKWLLAHIDPTSKQKNASKKIAREQLSRIGIKNVPDLSDYEMTIASHLVNPADIPIGWGNIAGLNEVIKELQESVIFPVRMKNLFVNSRLMRPPKGVLLYGPPGCGKTMIAKATAREGGMRFINLDVSILMDKWYGESQKLASAVFTLAMKLQPCIIFIDEIDSFLRNRTSQDHEATAIMKAQFMSLWDGLITDPDCAVIVMGATNRPEDLDAAILRRMPNTFHIKLPNCKQREEIILLSLNDEDLDPDVTIGQLATETDNFSGSDLFEMCRNASIYRIKECWEELRCKMPSIKEDCASDYVNEANLRPICMDDFMASMKRLKESKMCYSGMT